MTVAVTKCGEVWSRITYPSFILSFYKYNVFAFIKNLKTFSKKSGDF